VSARTVDPLVVPRRRRRVWPIVLGVVVILLVIAYFVADAAARTYAQNRIRSELVSALGIPASSDVTVDVGGGSVLLQAATGKLDAIDVSVPKLSFGELVGAATVHATDVPIDEAKPLSRLRLRFAVGEKDVSVLAKNLSGLPLTSVVLTAPDIVAHGDVTVLGASVPVGIGLKPSVSTGDLVFTPTSVQAAGQTFTVEQLTSNKLLGGLAKSLLKQQSFCVAQYLPKALTLTSANVVAKTMVVTISGDGAVLGGSGLRTKGTCP
jgi:hypothetical protein